MSERKVLNKYYPPDFDPSKIPRMKLAKNRQYTVRLMAPFNMRCVTCGEYIYKGKKFNARKEDVENESYLGIRIYRFYIKCTRCLQEISFKTDPKNTDYEIEAGATRNFMALKLAEEQARKEEEEAREEEATNPMKLLENRTQQSRNEIDLLESLEELRDLNRRQQLVDYETMLKQYNSAETEKERLERQEREDEEFIKSVYQNKKSSGTGKIVAEEIVEEVANDKQEQTSSTSQKMAPPAKVIPTKNSFGISDRKDSLNLKRKQPLVIVKPKTPKIADIKKVSSPTTATKSDPADQNVTSAASTQPAIKTTGCGGLSLLSAYSNSSEDSE